MEQNLINKCNELNLIYIDSFYKDGRNMISFICPKHKNIGIQNKRADHFLNAKIGCPYCCNKHLTTEDLRKFLNKYNIELLTSYIKNDIKVKVKCKECNFIWEDTPCHLKNGRLCRKCKKNKIIKENMILKANEYKSEINKLGIIMLDEYKGSKIKTRFKCINDGEIWFSTPYNVRKRLCGCPICNSSIGENNINKFLKDNNINFIRQYKFDDCIYKSKLRFDFFLTDYNICIEFQGEQHYFPVDFGGKNNKNKTDKGFILSKERDKIKREYCLKNNIKLIEVPYWEKNNIENFLKNKII